MPGDAGELIASRCAGGYENLLKRVKESMPTIPELFKENAARYADKLAVRFKTNHVREDLTFNQLLKSVEKIAKSLMALEIEKGDRLAILSENRPRWAMLDLGGMMAGAIIVPVHTTFSGHLMADLVAHSEAKFLFVSTPELFKKIKPFLTKLNCLKYIVLFFETTEETDPRIMKWSQFIEKTSDRPYPPLDGDDICSLIYSSGTTGEPKGVSLTHNNFISNVDAALKYYSVSPNDVFLSFLPISHAFERTAGHYLPLLRTGSVIAYVERNKSMARNLQEVKPTILVSVPRVFDLIYDNILSKVQHEGEQRMRVFNWALRQRRGTWNHILADLLVFRKIRKALGGRLWGSVSGGAPLNPKIARFFDKVGIPLYEGYGMTESSPVISVSRPGDNVIGTVGKPIPGVTVKIAEDGEILAKGPNIMKGYWNNPSATRETIDEEGWLHTGDVGFFDREGNLTISGRKKEMIVTASGKNVWPEAVEQILNSTKYIGQSIVIGDKLKSLCSLIVPKWDNLEEWIKAENPSLAGLSREQWVKAPEIQNLIRNELKTVSRQLAEYERITKFILLANDFSWDREELTPTLKLRRKIITDHYKDEIETFYREINGGTEL